MCVREMAGIPAVQDSIPSLCFCPAGSRSRPCPRLVAYADWSETISMEVLTTEGVGAGYFMNAAVVTHFRFVYSLVSKE